jgi:hypothetical protein
MATSAETPDFRGNSSSCTNAPPVFLVVSTSFLAIKHFYRRKKGRTFAGVDGRIDRQEEQDLRIYGLRQDERLL